MGTTLGRRLSIVALVAIASFTSWRLTLFAGQPAQKSAAVRIVPGGQRAAGKPGEKGATYYSLEGQTTSLVTAFVDGTKAIAERGFDGAIMTKLEDEHGNEINRVRVVNNTLHYMPFAGVPVLAQADPTVRQTLDWSNQQSHRLHRDGVASGTRLEWSGGMMRKAGAPQPSNGDNDRDVRAIETHWANGLTARTIRIKFTPGFAGYNDKPVKGDILSTTLRRDGVEVGHADYLTAERIFAWSMPGVGEGSIATENLKQKYGGWLFTPDMIWMNLQALGTYHWRSLIKAKGTVARQAAPGHPLLQFFMPTVAANTEGCDGLHWLDGSVFRQCCDVHDYCYEKSGCSSSSWWHWGSWSCDYCNIWVVSCFVGGGPGHIRYPYGG